MTAIQLLSEMRNATKGSQRFTPAHCPRANGDQGNVEALWTVITKLVDVEKR